MSDQFTLYVPCLRDSSSSSNVERCGFTWKADANSTEDGNPTLTLSCQPTGNKDNLLWKCDAKVEMGFFRADNEKLDSKQWAIAFNSRMKCSESKAELGPMGNTDAVRIEIEVKVARNFIIDLSSPTNAFISVPSDAARFEIDGRVVYLSKNILTRCSPFFDAMFNRDFLEKNTDSYALREVDFYQVMHLMVIVHRKSAFIDGSSVGYLATLADMYHVSDVAELCGEFLRFYPDQQVANRETLSERCDNFHQERNVIETKEVTIEGYGRRACHQLEIGAFRCRLDLVRTTDVKMSFWEPTFYSDNLKMDFSLLQNDRSLLWRCVTQSSTSAGPVIVGNHFIDHNVALSSSGSHPAPKRPERPERPMRTMQTYVKQHINFPFCLKLLESDIIDLSSPENEFIKDPADAVCLQVDGEKLWVSKQLLTISCASFCDLFKEAKDIYVIDYVCFVPFLQFMAILHSTKFARCNGHHSLLFVVNLLTVANRFRCGYMIERCESFLWDVEFDPSIRHAALYGFAVRKNLFGLITKLGRS